MFYSHLPLGCYRTQSGKTTTLCAVVPRAAIAVRCNTLCPHIHTNKFPRQWPLNLGSNTGCPKLLAAFPPSLLVSKFPSILWQTLAWELTWSLICEHRRALRNPQPVTHDRSRMRSDAPSSHTMDQSESTLSSQNMLACYFKLTASHKTTFPQ